MTHLLVFFQVKNLLNLNEYDETSWHVISLAWQMAHIPLKIISTKTGKPSLSVDFCGFYIVTLCKKS
jgi:hypothetical protein